MGNPWSRLQRTVFCETIPHVIAIITQDSSGKMNSSGKRLSPWPTANQWVRIAQQPSRFAPLASEVLEAQQGQPPEMCRDLAELLKRFGAQDLKWSRGRLEACSLTGRAFMAGFPLIKQFANLKEIRLSAIDSCFDQLVGSPLLNEMEFVNLQGNRLGDERLFQLLSRIEGQQLRQLWINQNTITDSGWRRIRELPSLQKLIGLHIGDNPLSLKETFQIPHRVQHLEANRLGGDTNPASVTVPERLKRLELNFNQMGALPDFAAVHNLEQLELAGNRLRDQHFLPLLEQRFPELILLNLNVNYITAVTLAWLSDTSKFPNLRTLTTDDCPFLNLNWVQS
jgi:Leucine-rich repeat (LRR) protein